MQSRILYVYFTLLFASLFKFRPTSITCYYYLVKLSLVAILDPTSRLRRSIVSIYIDAIYYYYIIVPIILPFVVFSFFFFFSNEFSIDEFRCIFVRFSRAKIVRIRKRMDRREVELIDNFFDQTYCILCELSNSVTLPCAAVT